MGSRVLITAGWYEALALKVGRERNTFGLRDVYRLECYTDKSVWVLEKGEGKPHRA